MKILALDTASSQCGAAILDADRNEILAEKSEDLGKGHAEVLMDYVSDVVAAAELTMAEIDLIAVNVGPGSFTGVRIGVAAARGFALALGRPAVGITGFQALAHESRLLHPGRSILVLLDAHRGDIYGQLFDLDGREAAAPVILSLETAQNYAAAQPAQTVLAGTAAAMVNAALADRHELGVLNATGRIESFAHLARLQSPQQAPKPLYMRGPDAKPQTGFALPRRAAED